MGNRLKLEQTIDPGLSKFLMPPLVPTAGGERGAAWNPILAKSKPATHRGPYGRKMAGDERQLHKNGSPPVSFRGVTAFA